VLLSVRCNRAEGKDASGSRLDRIRHLLYPDARPVRRRPSSGPGPVLDRSTLRLAVAALSHSGGRLFTRPSGTPHFRLLHSHRSDDMGPVRRPYDGINTPTPSSHSTIRRYNMIYLLLFFLQILSPFPLLKECRKKKDPE